MLQSKNRNIAVGEQRAFEYWLRTGRTLRIEPNGVEEAPVLHKYNHNHDPRNGQFASGPGGASARGDSVTIDLRTGVQRHRNGSVIVPLDPPKPAHPRTPVKHYATDGGIKVPPGIEPQVNAMAKEFQEKAGRPFRVMSGNRTPEGQAAAHGARVHPEGIPPHLHLQF